MEEILAFLKKNKVFHVATIEGSQPRVRPFGAVILFENKLYFYTNQWKDVYRQLRLNPQLEISSYGDGEWLRLTGEAVFASDNKAAKQAMLDASPEKARLFRQMPQSAKKVFLRTMPGMANMLNAEDDSFEIFYIKNMVARFYSFKHETKVKTF